MTRPQGSTLAFDIGGTNLRAALVDDALGVVDVESASSGRASPDDIARRAAALARVLEARHGVRARGAGCGIAAMVPLPGDLIENAPNLGWRDAPFRALLESALDDRPVVMVNDLDAIALGEQAAGAARGLSHVLFVFVGTGVGSGIVVDGKILRGARGVAGELGHTKVVVDGGKACGCGAVGCLEAYAGGGPLASHIEDIVRAEPDGALAVRSRAEGALHLSLVDELARDGDPAMRALVEDVSDKLGLAVANAITLLNPNALVLGGGVLARCHTLKARVVEKVMRLTNAPACTGLVVLDGSLGDHAGLVGAARAFALEHV